MAQVEQTSKMENETVSRHSSVRKSSIENIVSTSGQQQHNETTESKLGLLDLPNEIIAHILTYLDNLPPSHRKILEKPEYNLTFSDQQPLKALSQMNHRFRSLVLPLLLRHARVDPYQLSAFMSFIDSSGMMQNVVSVTAHLQGPCSHIHPAWWSRLLAHLPNLETLKVHAQPHVFAEIGQVSIDTSHSWAFKIAYHTMTLSSSFPSPITANTTSAGSQTHVQASSRNILTGIRPGRPWTTLHMNEASHIPAYSNYEYFLKPPPSLLTALQRHHDGADDGGGDHGGDNDLTRFPPPEVPLLTPATYFLTHLLSFHYTAIFPFYNHVDEVLKLVRQMPNLRRLVTKLCPEPDSNELQDEMERNGSQAGRTEGRIDVNDPWNEFDTSYTLIPHTVIYLTTNGRLEEFQTDDVKMSGIRDTLIHDIDRRLDGLGCWRHVGDGVWKRDMEVKFLLRGQGNG